jgi:hypothetical protein
MTQDTVRQSYRGVICLHCMQPIPISPFVASIEAELPGNETTPLRRLKCQVFNLRCAACGKEKPYRIGEILDFEGTPATGTLRAEPASAYARQPISRPRTANA